MNNDLFSQRCLLVIIIFFWFSRGVFADERLNDPFMPVNYPECETQNTLQQQWQLLGIVRHSNVISAWGSFSDKHWGVLRKGDLIQRTEWQVTELNDRKMILEFIGESRHCTGNIIFSLPRLFTTEKEQTFNKDR